MRHPCPVRVDDLGAKTADIPSIEGQPTVLVLDKLRVTGLSNPATADALILAIEPPRP